MTDTRPAVAPQPCLLTESQVYAEFIRLSPISCLPDGHSLAFQSRLATAKDPDAVQTRHHMVITADALRRLHDFLGLYLSRVEASRKA